MVIQRGKFVFVEFDRRDRVTSGQKLFAHCVKREDMAASIEGVEDKNREGKRSCGKKQNQKTEDQHGDLDFDCSIYNISIGM